MFSLKLTALLLAGVAIAHAAIDDKEIITLNPEEGTGNYKLQVVKEGPVTKLTFQNDESETVTEIFAGEGYEAEKQEGSDECNLKRLNETDDTSKKCSDKSLVTKDEVPATVATFCGERTLYVVESVPCNKGTEKRKRGCYPRYKCYPCYKNGAWRFCCGIFCM